MTDVLNVAIRSEMGRGPVRRLRRAGHTPAILYGHGEANVSLTVPTAEVKAALRHGSKLVDLQGGVNEKALIRVIQWDCYGTDPLHLDLTRVSEQEKVQITVSVELKGEAPGAKEGGVVSHQLHEVEIECPAVAIPDRIIVSIKGLHLDQHITLEQVTLPPHVVLVTPADTVVVSCEAQGVTEEAEEGAGGPAEPEVIGRKDEEEGEEEA